MKYNNLNCKPFSNDMDNEVLTEEYNIHFASFFLEFITESDI